LRTSRGTTTTKIRGLSARDIKREQNLHFNEKGGRRVNRSIDIISLFHIFYARTRKKSHVPSNLVEGTPDTFQTKPLSSSTTTTRTIFLFDGTIVGTRIGCGRGRTRPTTSTTTTTTGRRTIRCPSRRNATGGDDVEGISRQWRCHPHRNGHDQMRIDECPAVVVPKCERRSTKDGGVHDAEREYEG